MKLEETIKQMDKLVFRRKYGFAELYKRHEGLTIIKNYYNKYINKEPESMTFYNKNCTIFYNYKDFKQKYPNYDKYLKK